MAWISRYSTLAILIGLCIAFSFATLAEQQPSTDDSVRQIVRELRSESPHTILVFSSGSDEDRKFAEALQSSWSQLEGSNALWNLSVVEGSPQDARKAISESSATRIAIVPGPSAQSWKLFEGLPDKFPGKSLGVVSAKPVLWPNFLKSQNLINIVNQIVIIAILAIGMTLVILTGGIDLSVGSLIALSAVICTKGIRDWAGGENADTLSLVGCGCFSLLVCWHCGLVNGLLVVGFKIPPFIATLAMMLIASGVAFLLSRGQSIATVPESFVWLGRGTWMGVPIAVLMMIGMYLFAHVAMRYTVYGRAIYAIGGNPEAARLCGIRVRSLVASTYGLSGFLAGLGGLVMASRLKSGEAKYGAMYELYVIAAVVVGGTSLRGGYGTVLGTLLGALIIAVIENGMNLVQIESYTQKVVFGSVILGAVLLDRRSRAREE
jgi:ribose transport system permease protein